MTKIIKIDTNLIKIDSQSSFAKEVVLALVAHGIQLTETLQQ
jgi:hypothetical protein